MVVRAYEGSVDCSIGIPAPEGTVGAFDSRYCGAGNTTRNYPVVSGYNSLSDTSEGLPPAAGSPRKQDGFLVSFDYPVSNFSVSFADWGDYFPNPNCVETFPSDIELIFYDKDGNSFGNTLSTQLNAVDISRDAAKSNGIITLDSPFSYIREVEIRFRGKIDPGVAIDDIAFTPPGPDLCAAQDIPVGNIIVWNDDTNLYVKYVITDSDWCITETHLHVAQTVAEIPQKNGNPPPGKFDYGNDDLDCTDTDLIIVPLDGLSDKIIIAAHAVVKESYCDQEQAVVYGMERYNGKVLGVDVVTGQSWEEFDTSPPPDDGSAGPNGLAYDAVNERMYYCDYLKVNNNTNLYFWDLAGGGQTLAGSLGNVNIADADFYGGKYYYITGPAASDDLYEVQFNADGTIAADFPVKLDDITYNTVDDPQHAWTFNGDIAINDGVIYGWGKCSIHNQYEFFKYDIDGGVPAVVNATAFQGFSMQLAFGSNGTLYGHESKGIGPFYVVSTTNGDLTPVVPTESDPWGHLYTDCASGGLCDPAYETAWGNGAECGDTETFGFDGKNWATYIKYTVAN